MKQKNLLFQLSHLESHLNDFSNEKLSVEEAHYLNQSFQFFKRNLLEKISPSYAKNQKDLSQILKNTFRGFEKSANRQDVSMSDFDMETYDAIIEHYKSYGAVLESLKIESAMNKENQSATMLNKSANYTVDFGQTIDLNPILKDCMGEMDLLTELVHLYERNGLEFIGAAKIYLQNTDFIQLGLAAHKIKAGLAMMKTNSLHSIILQVEHACSKDKDLKHLQFLCDCFIVEFPIVRKALKDALANLSKTKG